MLSLENADISREKAFSNRFPVKVRLPEFLSTAKFIVPENQSSLHNQENGGTKIEIHYDNLGERLVPSVLDAWIAPQASSVVSSYRCLSVSLTIRHFCLIPLLSWEKIDCMLYYSRKESERL